MPLPGVRESFFLAGAESPAPLPWDFLSRGAVLPGADFPSLGGGAPAGCGCLWLLAFVRGRVLFRWLALCCPITGGGEVHHLPGRGGLSHARDRDLLIRFSRLGLVLFGRCGIVFALGIVPFGRSRLLCPRNGRLFCRRGCRCLGRILYRRSLRFGWGRLFRHRRVSLHGLRVFRLGELVYLPSFGNILFVISQ